MTTIQESKPASLTFAQKYGIKFYSALISQALVLYIAITTRNVNLALSFVSFYNIIGHYLPVKVEEQKQISKLQNNNKWILGPLIASCLSTPVILFILWRNYDNVIPDSIPNILVSLFAFGFTISGSIDAAHELLHRTQPICKFFCYMNLFFLQFTIYPTQHLYLHHKKVGTLEDPITAPKNKSIYSYYANALFSCYKFNYHYCKKIFTFNVGCTMLYNMILVAAALKQGSSINKAFYFSVLSYIVLFIMEGIEYIEHYGLVYRKDDKAKPVTEICSWNTSQNQLLNWFVFRFQRHSDHHMNAYKIYPTLDLTEKMPQFPFDFVQGAVMCLIPPLWFKLINPLADQVVEGAPVSKQHRNFLMLCFNILKFFLFILFPIRLAQHMLF